MVQKKESFFEKHTLAIILLVLYYAMTLPVIKNLYLKSCGPIISTGVMVSCLLALVISIILIVKMKLAKTYSAAEYIVTLLLIYVPLAFLLAFYYRGYC